MSERNSIKTVYNATKNLQHLKMSEYLNHDSKMLKVRQLITYQKGL
jgi:hypothetical protein